MSEYHLEPKFIQRCPGKTERADLDLNAGRYGHKPTSAEQVHQEHDFKPQYKEEVIIVHEVVDDVATLSNKDKLPGDEKPARRWITKSFTGLDKDVIVVEYKSSSKMNSDILYLDPDESDSVLHSPHQISVNKVTEFSQNKVGAEGKIQKTLTCH